MRSLGTMMLALVIGAGAAVGAGSTAAQDDTLVARARAIHEKVIALDTHVDIDIRDFTPERNYTQRLDTQVDIPKMSEGGLDAVFFIVYVAQANPETTPDAFEQSGYDRAYQEARAKFDAIHRLTKEIARNRIGLALTADDVRRIHASGRKVALIGVENGYSIGTDIGRVKEFYDRGARYMSLAHNGHSQLSDSNSGEATGWKWNGLSPLGRQVIAEMNRVGMMIDVSHPSKASMMQAVQSSKAPIIASHSSARALANHSRNLDDEQLLALQKNGGVVQTVAFGPYVKQTDSAERTAALAALRRDFGLPPGTPLVSRGATRGADAAPGGRTAGSAATGSRRGRGPLGQLSAERRAELDKRLADIDRAFPPLPPATVKDFVDHIDYIIKKIGIDHVGISSDFDGGGGVQGWNDASETFNVTLELVRRGYTEQQIDKIWSGNLLRVMAAAAKVAQESRTGSTGR